MKKITKVMFTIGLLFLGAEANAMLPAVILIVYLVWRI